MDERFKKLTIPKWTSTLRHLEKQTSIAALMLQESGTAKLAMSISKTASLASRTFHEYEFMKASYDIPGTARLANLAFQDSVHLKSIEKITESFHLTSLAIHEANTIKAIRQFAESKKLATIALQQSKAAQQLADLCKLPSFNALAKLKNSPFTESLALGFDLISEDTEEIDKNLTQLDSQISSEVKEISDFNDLSEKTRKILVYIYHYYILPVILSVLSAYIVINAEAARKELESVSTLSEVKSFARSGGANLDRSALKAFRITTAKSLNLRETPNIKSETIASLPLGTLAEVIDNSNRSWLLVEVEINGTLTHGWIFRRYTTHFK